MKKSRFMQEFSGDLGPMWQLRAEKELAEIKQQIIAGKITIDDNGVGYNCIGRVLMDDLAEKVYVITPRIDLEATAEARDAECHKWAAEYRKSMKNHVVSEEERFEMEAAFGKGTKVVNVLTGQTIQL